ncbi:glycosyltransferase family 4 protein [Herbaspirillum rhizosphaerae]|uniref:glycosyltransferase family 4 protein n=1 Tax=Herbaspirillum rhizosphaerae TaxID=346179 RepID=UPI00067AE794|nr:glycosyltransferase family 4 protein [Herbaspirillum rhizosphaerae]
MKILLLNDEFYTTGASIAMLRLAERLVQNHEVSVMARIDGEGEIKKKFEELGIPIVKDIQAGAIDLLIANTLLSGAHVAQAAPKVPVIWWIHEAEVGRDMILRFPQLAEGFKHASHIVFQTEFQRIVYGSFLFDSPATVHVMPFWNDAIYRQENLQPESKPANKKRIVSIGTIEPRKRVADTIMAIDSLEADLRNQIECVFIGKYLQLAEGARKLADAFPERYRMLGELPNEVALSYMASADLFVLASDSESQPLTIWEAFELEVPVCLSDLETYRHVGLRHARNAMMHPVGNVDILATNIRMMLTNDSLRKSVTSAGKSLLLKNLTDDWTDRFERLVYRVNTETEIKKLGF